MKVIRVIIVAFLALLFSLGLFLNKNEVQYSLVKAILPSSISQNSNIITLSDKTSKTIHIIFEDEDEDNLESTKEDFLSEIDPENFEAININPEKLFRYYVSQNGNFLSPLTKELLKNQNYEIVSQMGLERLYNPASFSLAGADKDPYGLLTDFVLSNDRSHKNFIDGKNYIISDLNLKGKTDNVRELISLQQKYAKDGTKIYLTGTPVHTYLTSSKANMTINLICAVITLLIVGLTWYYFKSLKILPLVALSIAFGFLGGFSVAKATFLNFHIITVLFGVTLIGIGVDYSIHYLFSSEHDKTFYKNLTLSMVSTLCAFSLLFFLKIEVMSQIALFTIIGLICVYLFIILIYPLFALPKPVRSIKTDFGYKKIILALSLVVIVLGVFHIRFNDDLSALYTPTNELKESEALYSKLTNNEKTHFLTVRGQNFEEILEVEEQITDILNEKGVDYLCVSKFLPSQKRQRDNFELVKGLYGNNLGSFKDILFSEQIQALKNQEFKYSEFNLNDAPYLKNLVLSSEVSVLMYFSSDKITFNIENVEQTDIRSDVSGYLKNYRQKLLKLLPFVYFLIFVLFFAFYGKKRAIKMFLPIFLSSLFTVSLLGLFFELNLFHFLALLLVLGFTVDYSLFSSETSENTKNAIFLACITTGASFLLLSFTGFALLNSLALTLFVGILSSYVFIKVFE